MKQKNLYQMIITTEDSNKALKSYYSSTIKEGMKTSKKSTQKKQLVKVSTLLLFTTTGTIALSDSIC